MVACVTLKSTKGREVMKDRERRGWRAEREERWRETENEGAIIMGKKRN